MTAFLALAALPLRSLTAPTILAMNAFPAGTRVFFWSANSKIVYGVVQSTSVTSDGTQVLQIRDDSGKLLSLPAAGITRVT